MRTLSLELDELSVESFATAETAADEERAEWDMAPSRLFSACRSCERTCTCETW